MSDELILRRVHAIDDPDLQSLVNQSDAYLGGLYPPESNHAEPLEALVSGRSAFFSGYIDDRLAACGAVKLLDDDGPFGEIKRVFVDPQFRGRGLASAVMRHLENHLVSNGIYLARLEAGPRQPEALALYRKLGYTERGPFGAYTADPLSVFMEKTLSA